MKDFRCLLSCLNMQEDKEKKKTDLLERKKEKQKILDEELAVLASKQAGKSPVPDRLTRAEADAHRIALNAADKGMQDFVFRDYFVASFLGILSLSGLVAISRWLIQWSITVYIYHIQ